MMKGRGGTAKSIRALTTWCTLLSLVAILYMWNILVKKRSNYRWLWTDKIPEIEDRILKLEKRGDCCDN